MNAADIMLLLNTNDLQKSANVIANHIEAISNQNDKLKKIVSEEQDRINFMSETFEELKQQALKISTERDALAEIHIQTLKELLFETIQTGKKENNSPKVFADR